MGYYTYFSAETNASAEVETQITEELFKISSFFNFDKEESVPFSQFMYDMYTTWYDWDKEMVEVSRKFPEVTITMWGNGEESDDMWKCVFKNGKKALVFAEIVYPEITEKDFE